MRHAIRQPRDPKKDGPLGMSPEGVDIILPTAPAGSLFVRCEYDGCVVCLSMNGRCALRWKSSNPGVEALHWVASTHGLGNALAGDGARSLIYRKAGHQNHRRPEKPRREA